MDYDPIQVEVWRHLFASVAEEMGATLERTGYSPNIKERRDHSCALFDAEGRLLAQAAHIPVHLGAMPLMMARLRHSVPWSPGVMWLCNDPAHGGTHLPDLTLVAPVYAAPAAEGENGAAKRRGGEGETTAVGGVGEAGRVTPKPTPYTLLPTPSPLMPNAQGPTLPPLLGFVANRAHHADIGGMAPGSLPLSTELFHEGLIIPPVRLVRAGRLQADVLTMVCANSRAPAERKGDLAAQVAANRTGIWRLQEMVARYGRQTVIERADEARRYAEAAVIRTLAAAPDRVFEAVEWLDDDGAGNADLPIRVRATLCRGRIAFDFRGTAPQAAGSVNCTEAVTRSACYYVVRCLVAEEIPMNDGAFAPITVVAPAGTLVNARFPAAVAAGNVETSQRIVDVLLGALAPAFPDRIPACSQGTMNNLLIGGWDPFRERGYAYYETIAGGAGASALAAGASAVHSHMTNTRNTPIEALEMHYPLRVRQYRIRDGSGGAGTQPGGDGVVRSVELLADAHVSIVSERRRHNPPGLEGGEPGARGRNSVELPDGTCEHLDGKTSVVLQTGTLVTVETPGGAGYGAP